MSSGSSFAMQDRVFRNRFGLKLLFDPFIDAGLLHLFEVAGARAEGEAVEGVQRFLIVSHLRDFRRGESGGRHRFGLWLFGGETCCHHGQAEDREENDFSLHNGYLYYLTRFRGKSCAWLCDTSGLTGVFRGLKSSGSIGAGVFSGPIQHVGGRCGGCSGELYLHWLTLQRPFGYFEGGETVGCGENFFIRIN